MLAAEPAVRKAKATPSFDHYLHALSESDEALVTVLKGHLVIEALLVELIQLRVSTDSMWRWTFPAKTSKCVEFGFITQSQADALDDLNNLRNDFAHILGQDITFDRVFTMAQKAANARFDFSDDTIHQDRVKAEEWYGIDGGLLDILNSFYFDLAHILHDNNGPDRTGANQAANGSRR